MALAACAVLLVPAGVQAQRGGRGGPPPTPRAAAAMDLTGYWVSVITEDWKFRMVTPKKGVYETLMLNAEGRRIGDAWDPARDEAAGEQCRAYGAANIMRMPGGCTSRGPTTPRSRSRPTPAPRRACSTSARARPPASRAGRDGRRPSGCMPVAAAAL